MRPSTKVAAILLLLGIASTLGKGLPEMSHRGNRLRNDAQYHVACQVEIIGT